MPINYLRITVASDRKYELLLCIYGFKSPPCCNPYQSCRTSTLYTASRPMPMQGKHRTRANLFRPFTHSHDPTTDQADTTHMDTTWTGTTQNHARNDRARWRRPSSRHPCGLCPRPIQPPWVASSPASLNILLQSDAETNSGRTEHW